METFAITNCLQVLRPLPMEKSTSIDTLKCKEIDYIFMYLLLLFTFMCKPIYTLVNCQVWYTYKF